MGNSMHQGVLSENVTDTSLAGRPEWEAVLRILGSPAFARSPRLSAFLRYIAERKLFGLADEISEQMIAVRVFGRPPGYNASEDSIVRSQARLLRQKLEAYYLAEGAAEDLVLEVPKGGYVPHFTLREPAVPAAVAVPPTKRKTTLPWAVYLSAAVVLGTGVGYWIGRSPAPPAQPSHPLWSRIFQKEKDTVFVACDSGLVLFQNLTQQRVGLPEYMSREYRAKANAAPVGLNGLALDFASRRYTTIVDLQLAARFARLVESAPERFKIRFSRDAQLDQFKEANLILSGAQEANPWLELFQKKLNFQILYDHRNNSFRVVNRNPKAGERPGYDMVPGDPARRSYGLLALQPGIGSGNVLILEGTTMSGTEAVSDFVFNDAALLPEFRRIRGGRYFELLFETTNLDGQAPHSQLIAWRTTN